MCRSHRQKGPRQGHAVCVQTSSLRYFSTHAPGSRRQGERAVLAISEQALAHASFKLPAAISRERYDVSAPWACAFRKRLPIIVERWVRLVDHQRRLLDVDQSSLPPQIAQLALAGKLHVTLVPGFDSGIECNGFVPE